VGFKLRIGFVWLGNLLLELLQPMDDRSPLAEYPADLARYPVAKLISEGAGPQDAIVMTGYKQVPGIPEETIQSGSNSLRAFHPLHA
jgi:hypothetical protein